jgi:hypothetical protein
MVFIKDNLSSITKFSYLTAEEIKDELLTTSVSYCDVNYGNIEFKNFFHLKNVFTLKLNPPMRSDLEHR